VTKIDRKHSLCSATIQRTESICGMVLMCIIILLFKMLRGNGIGNEIEREVAFYTETGLLQSC
jgi:hypothetical protein